MEFDIKKFAMLIMKRGKRLMMKVLELPNEKNPNALRKGKLQILGNIRNGHHQTSAGKEKKEKNASYEWESFLKPNSATEISSKG